MPLSLANGPDEQQSVSVIRHYLESGGNFIDTANVYCRNETEIGANETLVARALRNSPVEPVYVATKGGLRMQGPKWSVDASPAYLQLSCERSLKSLECESIFLYQLHAADPNVDWLETIGTLKQLKTQGKIQHIGLCNVNRQQLLQALEVDVIFSVQNRCSLFHQQDMSHGMIDLCHERDVLYIAHSPVGGHFQHAGLNRHPFLAQLAEKYKTNPHAITLAYLLNTVRDCLPIPGATRTDSVDSSIGAESIRLNSAELAELHQLRA